MPSQSQAGHNVPNLIAALGSIATATRGEVETLHHTGPVQAQDEARGSQCVAMPALLCHKDTVQGTQSPFLGAFLPFAGSLWHKGGFHAWKGSIIGTFMP